MFSEIRILPQILSCAEMQFLEIRSKVKNHHISEGGVSFENIVWSVYQDMGWRTHFLHMAANYRLRAIGERIFAGWVGLWHIIYDSSYKILIFPLGFVVVNRG